MLGGLRGLCALPALGDSGEVSGEKPPAKLSTTGQLLQMSITQARVITIFVRKMIFVLLPLHPTFRMHCTIQTLRFGLNRPEVPIGYG